MTVRELINALKKAPGDANVKIWAYGYSEGKRAKFDIDDIIENRIEYEMVITYDT